MADQAKRAIMPIAAKLVVGMEADGPRRMVVLLARGPLDASDTAVALSYAQLKHLAGQLITQEAEQEIAELGKRPSLSVAP